MLHYTAKSGMSWSHTTHLGQETTLFLAFDSLWKSGVLCCLSNNCGETYSQVSTFPGRTPDDTILAENSECCCEPLLGNAAPWVKGTINPVPPDRTLHFVTSCVAALEGSTNGWSQRWKGDKHFPNESDNSMYPNPGMKLPRSPQPSK